MTMQSVRSVLLSGTRQTSFSAVGAQAARGLRWRHPFDSAAGTIALGVLLTIALVFALRLLNG